MGIIDDMDLAIELPIDCNSFHIDWPIDCKELLIDDKVLPMDCCIVEIVDSILDGIEEIADWSGLTTFS